jgi:phosphoribosylaminoimidazole-succinocarboxamide synthase
MTEPTELHEEPGPPGTARLVFSDAYAIPGWGVMPDRIPGKGAAACTVAAHNAELLDTNHIPITYRGVYPTADATGDPQDLGACDAPPAAIGLEMPATPSLPTAGNGDVDGQTESDGDGKPATGDEGDGYDYGTYHATHDHYRLPLSVVVRTAVPPGAAVRERTTPASLGVDPAALTVRDGSDAGDGTGVEGRDWPSGIVELPDPVVEYVTTQEPTERTLDREEAADVAGPATLDRLEELALAVHHVLSREAGRTDLRCEYTHVDLAYRDGTIEVTGAVGAPEGWQYTRGGRPVSGAAVAPYYRREHPTWVAAVSGGGTGTGTGTGPAGDGTASDSDAAERAPPALPATGVAALSDLYGSLLNAYTRWEWVDAPGLDDALDRVGAL